MSSQMTIQYTTFAFVAFRWLRTRRIIYYDIYIFFTNSTFLLHLFLFRLQFVCFKRQAVKWKSNRWQCTFLFCIEKVCIHRCTLAISFCINSILDFCVTKSMTSFALNGNYLKDCRWQSSVRLRWTLYFSNE